MKLANHQYSNNHHGDNYFRQQILKLKCEGLPGGPVVKTSSPNASNPSSVPDWGAKNPHAACPKIQSIKRNQYCNNQ